MLGTARETTNQGAGGTDQSADQSALHGLLAARLRKFLGQLPRVLSDEDAEAIHDLRVWSRRLQQVVSAMFPKPRSPQAQDVVVTLRRTRRAVGAWRDCDVLIELVQRKLRRLRQGDERRAWETVAGYLRARRERAIARARRRLANRRLFGLAQSVKSLTHAEVATSVERRTHGRAQTLTGGAIKESYALWNSALSRACKSLDPADVHAFRVQSKRLRYRLELARDLGASETKPALGWLRGLQDALGRLHDRGELARMATKALADADFLLAEPRAASRLLAKLATERKARRAETEELLANVKNASQLALLEDLIERHTCKPGHEKRAPDSHPAEGELKLA